MNKLRDCIDFNDFRAERFNSIALVLNIKN